MGTKVLFRFIRIMKESPMVAKCANPACKRIFRELSKGRLFLLPPARHCYSDPLGTVDKLSDYCYWLCPECDGIYTIMRHESEVVVSVRAQGTPHPNPISSARPRRKRPGQVSYQSQSQAG